MLRSDSRLEGTSWAVRAMRGSLAQLHIERAKDDPVRLTPVTASPLDPGVFASGRAASVKCCESQSCCRSQTVCPGVARGEMDRRSSAFAPRLWPVAVS